jgi:hypothetical protein
MRNGCGKVGGCGIVLLLGVVFTGMGFVFALLMPNMVREQIERLSSLEPLPAVVLADSAPGREVLAEGQISIQNEAVQHGLVAYVYERYENDPEGEQEWRAYRYETPPLLIDLPDGRIQVERDYNLRRLPSSNTHRNGDERYRGLKNGDAVLVVGTIAPTLEIPRINAEFVAGGTRDAYIESQRNAAHMMRILGWIFSGIGLVILGIAGIVALRSMN